MNFGLVLRVDCPDHFYAFLVLDLEPEYGVGLQARLSVHKWETNHRRMDGRTSARGRVETNLLLETFLLFVAEGLKSCVELGEGISGLSKCRVFEGEWLGGGRCNSVSGQ